MNSKKIKRNQKTLSAFIQVYCRKKHGNPNHLCEDCQDLLNYGLNRLAHCPLDPKPKCKNCHIHCYQPEYRRKIREVMKYSGIYFVKRGRLDWMLRYFMS